MLLLRYIYSLKLLTSHQLFHDINDSSKIISLGNNLLGVIVLVAKLKLCYNVPYTLQSELWGICSNDISSFLQ